MGKCEHQIVKGKRTGQVCNLYTNKTINEKFYCSSHVYLHKPKEEKPKDIVNTEKPKDIIITEKPKEFDITDKGDSYIITPKEQFIKERTISFDNGNSLDEIIEFEYQQKCKELENNQKEKPKTKNKDKILKKIDYISDRLYFIENHLKYNPSGKPLNIPEFEIWTN